MTFRPIYLAVAAVLFVLEVLIALTTSGFVRGSIGDMLVIALIYCLLRGLTRATPLVAVVASLAAGLAAEILQYLHLADLLGLPKGSVFYVLIGNTFSWLDLLMYSIGGALTVWLDLRLLQQRRVL